MSARLLSSPRSAVSFSGLALLLLAGLVSCGPVQTGRDQCPDINVSTTQLKDDAKAATMPAVVDEIIADALSATGAFAGGDPIMGCAVGIMEDNAVAHVRGYGQAEPGRPFTHGTPAVVGSVSKTWTALAALRLVELGLLDLEDTVSDHLPFTPAPLAGLTVRQLLSHTSGLQREPVFDPALNTSAELSQLFFPGSPVNSQIGIHPRFVYASILGTQVIGFEPNTDARYSNAGYTLLGAVIDTAVAGNPGVVGAQFASYESFVWRQVGLHDGNLSSDEQMLSQCLNEQWRQGDISQLARGFAWDDDEQRFVLVTHATSSLLKSGPLGWEGPAGAWAMTIGDLVRLMVAMQNDEIVSRATRDEMMTVHGSDASGNWGLGVNLITKFNRPVYMHDGAYPGFRARYTVWPAERAGIAVMCNGSAADMRKITDEIARALFFGGGSTGVLTQAQAPTVDEDDPGLSATVASKSGNVRLSARERRALVAPFERLQREQAELVRDREQREQRARRAGCGALLDEVTPRGREALRERSGRCTASGSSPRETRQCLQRSARELEGSGLLTRREASQVERCARFVEFDF